MTKVTLSLAGHKDDDAVWCLECEMWLNGPTQWEDHKIGKKHKKCLRKISQGAGVWTQKKTVVKDKGVVAPGGTCLLIAQGAILNASSSSCASAAPVPMPSAATETENLQDARIAVSTAAYISRPSQL